MDNFRKILSEATPEQWDQGLAWYENARKSVLRLAGEYGIEPTVAAEVVSALSPSNKWKRNIRAAERFIRAWAEGKDPLQVSCNTYGANKRKALAILRGARLTEVFKDPVKTGPFAVNILDPWDEDHVTVDRHMWNAWVGDRQIVGESGPRITAKRAARVTADIKALANEYDIRPNQIQAVIWVCQRETP